MHAEFRLPCPKPNPHLSPLPLGLAKPLPLPPLALLVPAPPLPEPLAAGPAAPARVLFVVLGVMGGGGGARFGVGVAFEEILVDACSANDVSVVLSHHHDQQVPDPSSQGRHANMNVVSVSPTPEESTFPRHRSKLSATGASGKSTQNARTFSP